MYTVSSIFPISDPYILNFFSLWIFPVKKHFRNIKSTALLRNIWNAQFRMGSRICYQLVDIIPWKQTKAFSYKCPSQRECEGPDWIYWIQLNILECRIWEEIGDLSLVHEIMILLCINVHKIPAYLGRFYMSEAYDRVK